MSRRAILIVEDGQSTQDLYASWLKEHAELLQALDSAAARRFIEERHGDIDGVIMDGIIDRVLRETTVDLVKLMKAKGFRCNIVARTSESRIERDMMVAGCTHAVPKADRPIGELKELFTILGFDIKVLGLDQSKDF